MLIKTDWLAIPAGNFTTELSESTERNLRFSEGVCS